MGPLALILILILVLAVLFTWRCSWPSGLRGCPSGLTLHGGVADMIKAISPGHSTDLLVFADDDESDD